MQTDFFRVGKIINTHGIKGELKVSVVTDFPETRFKVGNNLYITNDNSESQELIINSSRSHKNNWIISFKNLNDINLVEHFKGQDLFAKGVEDLPLQTDQFLYNDLINSEVIDVERGPIGFIKEIQPMPANDIWIVDGRYGEILLPVIDSVIQEVDTKNKQVKVELLEGLINEN